jgi:hypothetical protein
MWRWVTRGLVLTCLASLFASAALAQQFEGALDRPDPGVTQQGIVLVRGFVLDPTSVSKIELYVDDQFQHLVNQGLPRIDVVEAFPNYPGIHNVAPGFQTGFLASRFTNGPHTVEVRIYFSDGRVVPLGRRTIQIDNTINQAPFGHLDIPDAKGVYHATNSFPVNGWATDSDGIARIDVDIDGGIVQAAIYGDPRPDVLNSFPDFPASLFSGFVAHVDTTRIEDGVHILSVYATDNQGARKLIGFRTINILNSEQNLRPFGFLEEPLKNSVLYGTRCATVPIIISPPVNPMSHITPVRGWALDLGTRTNTGRVSYIELLVNGVRRISTLNCGFSPVFGAFANCYGLERQDVAKYYPNYPDSVRSGFMFTLDVGALLAIGVPQGSAILKVRVGDLQQTFAELPGPQGVNVFFTCAEINQDFASVGYIDVPAPFDYVGGDVTFQGWALDENVGVAAVELFIDGVFVGQAQIGFPRPDVQVLNPHIFNNANSGWRFTMDTRLLSNARHQLTARVLDQQGRRSIIGTVDFYVQNPPPSVP